MPTTIKLRNSVTTTSAPSSLVQGEVAINITDKKVWVGNAATTPIQLLGDGGSGSFTSIAFGAGTVSSPSITFTGDTNTGIYSPAADTIAFTEGGVESMRIDSSGNVGIRTTTPASTLDINGTFNVSSTAQFGGAIRLANNREFQINDSGGSAQNVLFMFTDNNVYLSSPVTGSSLIFRGTGYSERMRIDSSGNVGIGTSSPTSGSKLDVNGQIVAQNGTTSSLGYAFRGATNAGLYINDDGVGNNLVLQANGNNNQLYLQRTGNVGIGTSSPSTRLDILGAGNPTIKVRGSDAAYSAIIDVAGAGGGGGILQASSSILRIITTGANQIQFETNGSERMRITSGGNVAIGSTGLAGNERLRVVQADNSNTGRFEATNASQSNDVVQVVVSRNTTNNSYYAYTYYNSGAGVNRFQVADSGNVTNTNGSYGTISDVKNKENIVDATPKLDKVNQLKVRNFNFKGDDLKQIGFVAQEFEQVFPSMIEEHKDTDAEGNDLGTTTKSIKTSVLVPILVKAIQEQQAMIEELKQEVALLKSK